MTSLFRILLVLVLTTALCGCSMLGPLIGAALPVAGAKLMFSCIPTKTRIDTPTGPRAIDQLEAGDLVIGFHGRPVRILQKHAYLENSDTLFLRISFGDGASVDLCGMHRVAGIRAGTIRLGQKIAGRIVTAIECRSGVTLSFDLLTEDPGYQMQRVPVNSMIQEMHQAAASRLRPVH